MSVWNRLQRVAALALGIVLVSAAGISIGNPVLRTALVWLGVAAILWGLYGVLMQKMLLEAASLAAESGASAVEPAPSGPDSQAASGAAELAPISGSASAPTGAGARTPAELAQGPAFTGEKGVVAGRPDQRQYLALRRLTEQYLKEVRRMNLIAVWGREGTIDRQRALEEVRQIEMRMRDLTEKMKFAAGKLEG